MILSESIDAPHPCGQRITTEVPVPSVVVNKNLRNQIINKSVIERKRIDKNAIRSPKISKSKNALLKLEDTSEELPVKVKSSDNKPDSSAKENFMIDCEGRISCESTESEKESYQSILEYQNKMNMVKNCIESPKKSKTFTWKLKADREKGCEDEKDTVEFSTQKYEEDKELDDIMQIKFEMNEFHQGKLKNKNKNNRSLLIEDFALPKPQVIDNKQIRKKGMDIFDSMASRNDMNFSPPFVDKNRVHFAQNADSEFQTMPPFGELHLDLNDTENFKEFSQPSPKESRDEHEVESNNLEHDGAVCEKAPCNQCSEILMAAKEMTNSFSSDGSSDSNKISEEFQNLEISHSFPSCEKIKEVCDSENERSRTPSEQIPDKETIKQKLNEINKKKLKDMANIAAPGANSTLLMDKNDKNKSYHNEGCRPKVFTQDPGQNFQASQRPLRRWEGSQTVYPTYSMRGNHQAMNRRLKFEDELGHAGGAQAISDLDLPQHDTPHDQSVFEDVWSSARQMAPGRPNTLSSYTFEGEATQHEFMLPEPQWPCGSSRRRSSFTGSQNTSNNNSVNRERVRRKSGRKSKAL